MSNVDNSGNPVDPTTQDPATQTGQGQQEPIQQVDPDSLFADQLASIQTDEGRQKFNSVELKQSPTKTVAIPVHLNSTSMVTRL